MLESQFLSEDDLPVWGFVGEISEDDVAMVYTHYIFSIIYNEDRIIEIKLAQESPIAVKEGSTIIFRYTVQWNPTDIEFEHRFDRYLDDKFFEHQVHWFSIFNSFMMVFFLAGLVVLILLRTLKQDYAKYAKDEDEEDGLEGADDGGWKMVHGDVFRAPTHLSIFSALIGTGTQLVILAFCLIFLSVGFYHECASSTLFIFFLHSYRLNPLFRRGSIVTAMVVCYAFTSFISGYVGGSYYVKNGGKHWIKTLLYTALLLPGVVSGLAFLLNWVAVAYGSLAAIPFVTMLVVVLIWSFISLPLTFFGTIIGRNWAGSPDYPCRIAPVPRLIPDKTWHQEPLIHVLLGGILPFGSIFIEMYFVFTAFWQYKYYYVFGFLFLVYIIMILVSICVTIVSTYFLLNSEDYRWQWTSFGTAFSTAAYVFLYAIYYFFARTHMFGFMQISFYFGYMFLFCLTIGLVCGAVGFLGSEMFVRRIYKNIKID
jgi:transmembrane 9 superfamily member 3